MEIEWENGKAVVLKNESLFLSLACSIYELQQRGEKNLLGSGCFIDKTLVITCAKVISKVTGELRLQYGGNLVKVKRTFSFTFNEVEFDVIKIDEQSNESSVVVDPYKVEYESPIFIIGTFGNVIDGNIVQNYQDHSKIVANFFSIPSFIGAPVYNSNGECIAIVSHTANPVFSQLIPINVIKKLLNL